MHTVEAFYEYLKLITVKKKNSYCIFQNGRKYIYVNVYAYVCTYILLAM